MKKPSLIVPILIFVLLLVVGNLLVGQLGCLDGWVSPSIGKRGACSYHGGVSRWPSNLVFIFSLAIAIFYYVKRNDAYKKNTDESIASALGSDDSTESFNKEKNIKAAPAPTENKGLSEKKKTPSPAGFFKPSCPKCQSKMILRVAKRGRNIGGKFWGCGKYPRCKGTRPFLEEDGKESCPECNSLSMVEILYGYPTEEIFKDVNAGKVVLGGCIVFDGMPNKRCLECGHEIVSSA